MERLSLDLARFPDEEIALDVCGDAGAGRLYGDEEVKEWYLCLPSQLPPIKCDVTSADAALHCRLHSFLGIRCTLVRKSPTKLRKAGRSRGGQTEDEAVRAY
jgi:hypothetical protein